MSTKREKYVVSLQNLPPKIVARQLKKLDAILAVTGGYYPESLGGPKEVPLRPRAGDTVPVKCVELNLVFPSKLAASRLTGIHPQVIARSANRGVVVDGKRFEWVR